VARNKESAIARRTNRQSLNQRAAGRITSAEADGPIPFDQDGFDAGSWRSGDNSADHLGVLGNKCLRGFRRLAFGMHVE
jgi:hypothetical protein